MKTLQDRVSDSLNYITENGMNRVALLTRSLLGSGNGLDAELLSELSGALGGGELSLESRGVGHLLRKASKTEQRRAVRALLLCQAVFFSGLWPKFYGMRCTEPCNQSILPRGWATRSRSYWMNRTEGEIRNAIASFRSLDNLAPGALADAFSGAVPANGGDMLLLTRGDREFPGLRNGCYAGVMYWLFRAGFVGLPWLLRYQLASTREALEAAFGTRTYRVIAPSDAAPPQHAPRVHRGMICHIYCEEGGRWMGHWIVSLSDDGTRAVGINNDREDGEVDQAYSNNLNVLRQFFAYKQPRSADSSTKSLTYERGIMDVFDPRLIRSHGAA